MTMQSLNRALSIMRVVAARQHGLSQQELRELLDIPTGSLHRLLAGMVDDQYLTRSSATRRFFLGPAAITILELPGSDESMTVAPPTALTEAARNSGETTFLTEPHGNRMICVSLVQGIHPLRLFVRVGQEMPLHAAASARCVLAFLNPDARDTLLADHVFTSYTPGTPSTRHEVDRHLATVQVQGFDVCANELDDHVWAVAAPVFNATGRVASSITIAAAEARMRDPIRRTETTEIVLRAARQLSASLGNPAGERSLARFPGHPF